MKTQRIIRYGLRDLGRHRLRTFFMMLGTFVGVLALTLVVAIGQGTRDSVMGNIERMFAGNSILLSAGGGGMMGGPRAEGPTTTLVMEDLEEIQATVPGITRLRPHGHGRRPGGGLPGEQQQRRVLGHSENHEEVWNRGVSRGAFFGAPRSGVRPGWPWWGRPWSGRCSRALIPSASNSESEPCPSRSSESWTPWGSIPMDGTGTTRSSFP